MGSHERDNVVPFAATHDGADDPLFEAQLRRALEVAVPEGLTERILLRQTTAERHAPRLRWRAPAWRVAAVLALSVAGLGLFLSSAPTVQALPALAVAHTLHHDEPGSASRARMAPSQVRALFARSGVLLGSVPASVSYVNLCELGRDESMHLVSQEPAGPVTVYFVPGRVESARSESSAEGLQVRSLPLGKGSLVMLAATRNDFDAVEAQWRNALATAR
jgi:hypothetical protein